MAIVVCIFAGRGFVSLIRESEWHVKLWGVKGIFAMDFPSMISNAIQASILVAL